jgi:(hydroxyamino)benzene mutase
MPEAPICFHVRMTPLRHPQDPEPVRSTKAYAVLVLGAVAAITGFFIGGLIPATVALLLARQARPEMVAARGYLTGGRALRVGVGLSWLGIALAAAAAVILSIVGLLHLSTGTPRFGPGVN